MRSSFYDRRVSVAQIGSLDLMKINIVTPNVNQEGPSKTNKIRKVGTTGQHTANTQIHPSGKD